MYFPPEPTSQPTNSSGQPWPSIQNLTPTTKRGVNRTTQHPKTWSRFFCLSAAAIFCALPCYAALGGDASSVQQDQVRINATRKVTQTRGYTLHELNAANGVVVREYLSPSGKVFAVGWKGPWAPDLQHLLGTHFDEFQKALQSQSRGAGHGPVVVQLPGLVVELGGHMRSFVGRAYLPDQLPDGVRAKEIH